MDDTHTIQSNQFVHSLQFLPFAWTSAKSYSSTPDNYGYRPITTNFNQLSWFIGNGSPVAFQIGKKLLLLLLILVVVLVWRSWLELNGRNPETSWAALAFGFLLLHPVMAHSGNYISASSSLLCGLFYFLSLLYFLRYQAQSKNRDLFIASLSYFFSMMAKEEGVTLVAIIAICEFFYFPKGTSILARLKAMRVTPLFTLIAALGCWMIFSHFEPTSDIARGTIPRWHYFATQWHAYVHYLKLMVWPFHFNFDNLEFPFQTSVWTATNLFLASLHLSIFTWGLWLCGRKNVIGLGLCGFYIAILPASSIIPLAEPVNDHRALIAYLFGGFVIIQVLAYLSDHLDPFRRKIAFAILLIYLSATTLLRNMDFTSSRAIWVDTLIMNPHSPRAKNNLALEYMGEGNYELAQLLLRDCTREATSYSNCFTNLAIVYAATGQDILADQTFQTGMIFDLGKLNSRLFYSDYLIRRGRYREARGYLEEANQFSGGLNQQVLVSLRHVRTQLGMLNE